MRARTDFPVRLSFLFSVSDNDKEKEFNQNLQFPERSSFILTSLEILF